jgi:adenosylcobinamide kinase/adenosylcobinamide-phosphate guanylyltransferase
MSKLSTIILITGPCSSGKSEFAEALAAKNKLVTYVATAQIDESDRVWQAKIVKHQQRRPKHWQTVAASSQLPTYIEAVTDECLLIDSLGTWIANFMESDGVEWQQTSDRFLASLQNSRGKIIIVGEETGWGVVPAYPSGRLFRDRLGYLSRQVGNIASTTYLVTGGHVLNLSLVGEPLSKYGITSS